MPNIGNETHTLGAVEFPADNVWDDQTQLSLEVKHCHSRGDRQGSAAGRG